MAIGTISQAVRLVNDAASRAVPHVLPDRHIFSQYKFPFISDFFDVSEPKLGPGQQKFKMPGKIARKVTHHFIPKLYDHGTMQTSFETNGTAAQATADTDATISVISATGLRKYAMLKNRTTGAVIQVRSVSGTTITYRGFSKGSVGGGLDAIASGQKLDFLGYAYPDGATLVAANKVEPVERSNWMQFSVTETEIGILAEKRKLYPDNSNGFETDGVINAIQHNEGRERAHLFGEGDLVTIGGESIHAMKGLEGWSDEEYDCGGGITIDEWRQVIAPIVFAAGGGITKKACAGNTVLSVFDALLDGKIVYNADRDKLHIRLKEIGAPAGNLKLAGSQPMDEREGEMFCYDPDLMTGLYYEGLDMTLYHNLAPNNILKKTDAYMTAETLMVHNPESIVKLTNILA